MSMGPEFEVFITNRTETIRRRMFQYEDLKVEDPLKDSRTCSFSSPIYDINALNQSNIQHFLPYQRMVKVFYRGRLVFWGPIIKLTFNARENRVEVNAHDPSIWWKYHQFAESDEALVGVPVDGAGLFSMVQAAEPSAAEIADGVEMPGIVLGVGEEYLLPGESERRVHRVDPGANVFDSIQEVSDAFDGPDWDLVPIDANHDPYGVWEPGVMAAFVAKEEISRERQGTVIFHYGFGRMNLENYIFEPDGTAVRNRFISQNSRGVYRVGKYLEGMRKHGILEGWEEAPGDSVRPEALEEYARAQVGAYGEPPPIFTIEPMWDQGLMGSAMATPWRYPTGYKPGDRIRAVAKLGNFYEDHVGRVVKVTLSQLNAAENGQSQIECIPQPVDIEEDVVVENTIS